MKPSTINRTLIPALVGGVILWLMMMHLGGPPLPSSARGAGDANNKVMTEAKRGNAHGVDLNARQQEQLLRRVGGNLGSAGTRNKDGHVEEEKRERELGLLLQQQQLKKKAEEEAAKQRSLDSSKDSDDHHITLELDFEGGSANAERRYIKIRLLPEHSQSSASFFREINAKQLQLASTTTSNNAKCDGTFYRSEKGFLVQGRVSCSPPTSSMAMLQQKITLGDCPQNAKRRPGNHQCPAHDPNCGCHGPVMVQGMVGWAGGQKGPDFFIYITPEPAHGWYHDHTVWGIVDSRDVDPDSWATIDAMVNL